MTTGFHFVDYELQVITAFSAAELPRLAGATTKLRPFDDQKLKALPSSDHPLAAIADHIFFSNHRSFPRVFPRLLLRASHPDNHRLELADDFHEVLLGIHYGGYVLVSHRAFIN